MDKELFEQLTQSMKEAIAIAKGEMKPSRVFTFEAPDVRAVLE
jgi:hypothetical protein